MQHRAGIRSVWSLLLSTLLCLGGANLALAEEVKAPVTPTAPATPATPAAPATPVAETKPDPAKTAAMLSDIETAKGDLKVMAAKLRSLLRPSDSI